MKNKIRRSKCGGNSKFTLGPRKTMKAFNRDDRSQPAGRHSSTRELTTLRVCACVQ
jgi:hypothetical protein